MTTDEAKFPTGSAVEWKLLEKDVEFIEGGVSGFTFNESLQPCESLEKKATSKLQTVPILDWELRFGDFSSSKGFKQVSVSLKFERNEEDDKTWIHFYHDSWFLGKWNCTEWSPQFKQVIECCEVKAKEVETWHELVRAAEEQEKQESLAKKSRKKRRKVTPRDPTSYRYKDLKLHPLVMLIDSSGNWMVKIQFSLFCTINDANSFGMETNKLLGDLFLEKDPQYICNGGEFAPGRAKEPFDSLVVSYSKKALRKDVVIAVPKALDVTLMPFQMESIDWMLRKEGFYDEPLERITTREQLMFFLNEHISYGYEYMPINDSFWNKLTGYILPMEEAWKIYEEWFSDPSSGKKARGVLADEMGLGKTIEILTLISTNVRNLSNESSSFVSPINEKEVRRVKTNLIVCPESILQQWIDEIDLHINKKVSDFKVFHYEGFEKTRNKFNTDSPAEIVELMSQYDVVICSYYTMSAEVHYAEFSKIQRPSRDSTRRYDYTSPLSIMEFHRVILDEAQLLGGGMTNASRCTSLIHRVHTWGVSGTPVEWYFHIRDIFVYLQIHPFQVLDQNVVNAVCTSNAFHRANYAENPENYTHLGHVIPDENWNGVRGCKFEPEEIMDIFPKFNLAIRHRKKDVQDQIKIPPQINYMVPVEFNPIEQDNYAHMWNSFLADSGYDPRGNGAVNIDRMELSRWLNRLRMICCHASLLKDDISDFNYHPWRENDELKDMDAILATMKDEVLDRIHTLQRENYSLQLESGQVKMEIDEDFEDAANIFQKNIKDITDDLKNVYGIHDFLKLNNENSSMSSVKDANNIRLLLQSLHQAYFFLATSYYQLGSKKLEDIDAENEAEVNKVSSPKKNNNTNNNKNKNKKNPAKENDPKQYSDIFTVDQLATINKFQELEKENYEIAEKLRREMLHERIFDVDAEINKVRDWLMNKKVVRKMLLDSIVSNKSNFGNVLGETLGFRKISTLFHILNQQSKQFNRLIKDLEVMSYNTIVKDYENVEDAEKSKEYEKSVDEQDKVFSLLDVLERLLKNRDDAVASETSLEPFKPEVAIAEVDSKFHEELLKSIVFCDGSSLKMLLNEAENDKPMKNYLSSSKLAHHNIQEFINCYEMEITRVMRENQELRNILKKFNDIYNAKTNYYSYLQRISDSLVPLSELNATTRNNIIKKVTRGHDYDDNCKVINNLESRVRYLDTLGQLKTAIANGENISCAVCYSDIYTGSILKCGHFFCKDCVTHWFKKNTSCPMCKNRMSSSEVYHFKFREEELKEEDDTDNPEQVTKDDDQTNSSSDGNDTTHEEDTEAVISRKYTKFPRLTEVDKVMLDNTWGAKVDQVMKLILYIKQQHLEKEPHKKNPQIVIFSSHSAFLSILSTLLTAHNVTHARPLRNTKFAKAVDTFRKDPNCTCLLLNVHSQSTGLTLVNARHLILLEPIMDSSTEAQAISRIHRIGQKDVTYVWNFMVRNTVEESIMKYKAVLEGKKKKKTEELRASGSKISVEEAEQEIERNFSMDNITEDDSEGKTHLWHCLFENCI